METGLILGQRFRLEAHIQALPPYAIKSVQAA
jgi:hypothetical protein